MVRGLNFQISEVEELYYLCYENKGADQLRVYRAADLRLFFPYAKSRFSYDVAHIDYKYFIHSSGNIVKVIPYDSVIKFVHNVKVMLTI